MDVHKRKISYCVEASSGTIHAENTIRASRLDLDRWMKILAQPWSAATEATIFTGWIYKDLEPRAATLKVRLGRCCEPLPPQKRTTTASTPIKSATVCAAIFSSLNRMPAKHHLKKLWQITTLAELRNNRGNWKSLSQNTGKPMILIPWHQTYSRRLRGSRKN
jgi:hypothetical protein